jgi:hypothetical protein
MAKIKIVGRSGLVSISQSVAEKLAKSKDMYPPEHIVDIGAEGMLELGQIKQIILDDPKSLQEMEIMAKREMERQNAMLDWQEYVARCRREGVEEKARRMVNTWCMLCWAARGNKPATPVPKNVADELMVRLIDYFDKNPNEWTCTTKEYGDLIPFNKSATIASVAGFTSFVDAMQGKLI